MTRRPFTAVAPAKLNLGLEVLGRRPDGYHEILTVLQAISVFDRFVLTPTGRPFEYVGPSGIAAEHDLVLRALHTAADFSRWQGRLDVRKSIPIAAGLGGGSSDAALALRIAQPGVSSAMLKPLAAALGSDVPFFLDGGTAVASGTGAIVDPLPTPRLWFVVVTPNVKLPNKTALLYRGLSDDDFSAGDAVRRVVVSLRADTLPDALPNAFERQLLNVPGVRAAREALRRAGATHVAITGAGPSVYAYTAHYQVAVRIAERLPRNVGTITLARSIARRPDDPSSRAVAQALRVGGHRT